MLFKRAALVSVLLSSILLSGCVALLAAGAGAGTASYVEGVYSQNVDADMHKAYHAAIAGVAASNYTLTSKQFNNQQSKITAETKTTSGITQSTTSIHITIDQLTKKSSKISIRFGTFGDHDRSTALMHNIKQRL